MTQVHLVLTMGYGGTSETSGGWQVGFVGPGGKDLALGVLVDPVGLVGSDGQLGPCRTNGPW